MNQYPFESSSNNPNKASSYYAYQTDIESGAVRKSRKPKTLCPKMFKSLGTRFHHLFRLHPILVLIVCISFGIITVLILLSSVYVNRFPSAVTYKKNDWDNDVYPFANLKNLVMVAGHSVYTSSNCGKIDKEESWFLESYQKHPGQAATFLSHIEKGVEAAGREDESLLLFSGGETRKEAGPRSEAQSYWTVAESKGWFGKDDVRSRALTEEHARDSFENLFFSVCRFRELTGSYPHNITVVSYDFKEERFAHLHRSAMGFPESRFFYLGTPASLSSKEGALKGEGVVRAQFQEDPYGCDGSLWRKKLKRDPFHRAIPYPNGCPEIGGLFRYCGSAPYPGSLPWD
ncbi:hypothetical protein Bca4012_054151 [Brassica carinata]|uniref:DUF218 domain-containing protein n=1 Tax=Brassica carinata TaxID=52824 RepID=A0A8X7VZP9_BRACI|nr:hypothetical protein Bca52824_012818 [Brassica carinata]